MTPLGAFVISLLSLVPAGAESCLSDAIPPSQRQNLVNVNGETYPVGFFICNWAASFAANVLGATLVEEIFGYKTMLNDGDDVGSGTIAGYYGVAGCRTYNDVSDRGCMQGATSFHVGLEAWLGYPSDWDYIQNTYTSMAPKSLGSMGYTGPAGVFLPNGKQKQAYSTAGLALQYFRDWNASWNQPWNFFSSISSVNTSLLNPCNSSAGILASDAMLRRHVKFTGDLDGVIITNGTYAARCDDGFWWAAPKCRSDLSKCVPWITGGTGWGMEDAMQKFTFHDMPVAAASAASWGDYTSIPLSGDKLFYWWAPDPTFLELSPLFVKFPPHNARQHAEGKLDTATSVVTIASIVSPDLAVLAPTIESFIDNLDLPISHMNDMLLDQKTTGDTWRNVTCRWLKANRAMWEKWIPEESSCEPGFGLYDSVLHNYTDVRVNATNKIVCQACPAGKFSQKLEDSRGSTYICLACDVGTSQPSGASLSCIPCKAGEYQDEVHSIVCKRCGFGFYQDLEGQIACKACPASTNTLGLGSVGEDDCGCPANYINMDTTGGFNCSKCSDGLKCPALSQLADLQSGESRNGALFTPQIQKGFFSTKDKPTEVFECRNEAFCPGGTPGSCARGLVDIPCSQCAAGATWTGTKCQECAGWREVAWVFAISGIFVSLTAVYYLTTNKITAKASLIFSTTTTFGVLLMSMQNVGLIGMMTVDWPSSLQGIFSVCQFLLLNVDSYGFSCIAGQSEATRYMISVLMFPAGLAWLALCWLVSRAFAKKQHWDGPKVVSTMGSFLQLGYTSLSSIALAPMTCFQHPNGLKSLLKYPGVICGSAEHDFMLVISWLTLLVFVVGFAVLCIYGVWKVPAWSAQGKKDLVHATRFLVYRFRLDHSWWYGVPLLLRGPLINLPVVFATDHPPIQVFCIACIVTTLLVLQSTTWPWKVPLLNLLDGVVSFCMVLLVVDSIVYIDAIDSSMYGFANGISTFMLGGLVSAVLMMLLMCAMALFYRHALGGKKETRLFNLGSVPPSSEFAFKLMEISKELGNMDVDYLRAKIEAMSYYDKHKVITCITLLAMEVAPPEEQAKSFKFTKRIDSASFEPGAAKKTISSRKLVAKRSIKSLRVTKIQQMMLDEPDDESESKEAEDEEEDVVKKSSWL